MADDSVGSEVVNLIAEEDDALAKEETERVTGLVPGNHRTRANGVHERSFFLRRKPSRSEGSTGDMIT